jgi:hypothetical protein
VVDSVFHPDVSGFSITGVNGMAVAGNKIYVGGQFKLVGGKARAGLATLNPDGSVAD